MFEGDAAISTVVPELSAALINGGLPAAACAVSNVAGAGMTTCRGQNSSGGSEYCTVTVIVQVAVARDVIEAVYVS